MGGREAAFSFRKKTERKESAFHFAGHFLIYTVKYQYYDDKRKEEKR